jgi:hypothetical protein
MNQEFMSTASLDMPAVPGLRRDPNPAHHSTVSPSSPAGQGPDYDDVY